MERPRQPMNPCIVFFILWICLDMENDCSTANINKIVLISGYLPGVLLDRSRFRSPLARLPLSIVSGKSWIDVCGGGCGFALAITDSGKLVTWGSTDDLGQCYVTARKHEVTPEPFILPTDAYLVKAAAGWAHCVSVTDNGEVYTWGWKGCIPSGKKMFGNSLVGDDRESNGVEESVLSTTDDASCSHREIKSIGTEASETDIKLDESIKRQKISTEKVSELSVKVDENAAELPCLVSLNPGVRIVSVAAGGCHTLALSDVGEVWGWGSGVEGQLGQGSRVNMVPSPRPVPCVESSYCENGDRGNVISDGDPNSERHGCRIPGNYVKSIACGGRHSVIVTDAGAMLTFGWGLYGQCGRGVTDDELSPACVTSLLGINIEGISAGLWHTLCVSTDGDVYAFGGNQFGQLGTGENQAETLPKLLDTQCLENKNVVCVSCGARHSAAITGDGDMFSWGWNKYGQLGLGDMDDRNLPSRVHLEGFTIRNIACGWWHTMLLADDNQHLS